MRKISLLLALLICASFSYSYDCLDCEILFEEDWESGAIDTDIWFLVGSPTPVVLEQGHDSTYAIDNNGDNYCNSGVYTHEAWDTSEGLILEFWAKGNSQGTNAMYTHAGLCYDDPPTPVCSSEDYIGYKAKANIPSTGQTDSGYISAPDTYFLETDVGDDWHKITLALQPDGLVAFFRNDEHKYTSIVPLDLAEFTQSRFETGGKAAFGPMLVDDIVLMSGLLDYDEDGVADYIDNCVFEPNPGQTNSDSDEFGDACDNCPNDDNTDQADADEDGSGTVCDCNDDDGDVYPGATEDCDNIDNNCNLAIDEGCSLDFGMVAYWPLDSDADDVVGDHEGVVHGDTYLTDCVYDQCYYYDGSGDYIDLEMNYREIKDGPYTIALFAKFIEEPLFPASNTAQIFGFDQDCMDARLLLADENQVTWALCRGCRDCDGIAVGGIGLNHWYHFAATVDEYETSLYLEGELVETVNIGYAETTTDNAPGFMGGTPRLDRYINGYVDDAKIYRRVLTDDQIDDLAEHGLYFYFDPIDPISVIEGDLIQLSPVVHNPLNDDVAFDYPLPFDVSGSWQTQDGDVGEYTMQISLYDDYSTYNQLLEVSVVNNCIDQDGDGYSIEGAECGEIDCNDENFSINPGLAEICNGYDDNCDTIIDGDMTCDDGLFCNGAETCLGEQGCLAGISLNCTAFNLPKIEVCDYPDDGNPFTKDYAEEFVSVCDEATQACTEEAYDFLHWCSMYSCGAECEENTDCESLDCSHLTGCYNNTYREYSLNQASCANCSCEVFDCESSYSIIMTDMDNDGYGEECGYDCDDSEESVYPGAEELCDLLDNDCNGVVDDSFRDLDSDSIPDCLDDDDDNDGIMDDEDYMTGSASDIECNEEIQIVCNDTTNPDNWQGQAEVSLAAGNNTYVQFPYDFTDNDLDLSRLLLTINSDPNYGSIVFNGLELPENITKTIYLDRIADDMTKICIKDAPITVVSEISTGCDSVDEYLLNCDGIETNGYTCVIDGNHYIISGLQHSGVKEACTDKDEDGYAVEGGACGTADCNDDSDTIYPGATEKDNNRDDDCDGSIDEGFSSGGGGGSSGGSSRKSKCTEKWICTDWRSCGITGIKTRDCKDNNACGTTRYKPISTMDCEYIAPVVGDDDTHVQLIEPEVVSEPAKETTNIEESTIDYNEASIPITTGLVIGEDGIKSRVNVFNISVAALLVAIVASLILIHNYRKKKPTTK